MDSSINNQDNVKKIELKIKYRKGGVVGFAIENKSMINIKHLYDSSFTLFDNIFRNITVKDIYDEDAKINSYNDFYLFQINLNSYYKSSIIDFEYRNKKNISLIKEIPYKPTKLRKISEEDLEIVIQENGKFAKTQKIENRFQSSLSHYRTIIGNSILVDGVHYYELQLLSLGEDTDLIIGIISKNSLIFQNNEYRYFPISILKDSYSLNLNNHYEFENSNIKYLIKEGDIITVKIDLNENYIFFYINNKMFKNCKIPIKDNIIGFYPAFSLSSDKEIKVNFGGDYFSNKNIRKQIDKKPISQYNNLEKIVICYMKIIEDKIIKIINYPQITYDDSLRIFYPMLNFFGTIAFKDEFIIKNYFLKFFYGNYEQNSDINKYFDDKFNLIYLVFQTIESSRQKSTLLFFLDCLVEEIKINSYIEEKFDKWQILMKLYNYFLQKKLFQTILFTNEDDNLDIHNRIKNQLYFIFQPVKIFGIFYDYHNKDNISEEFINKEIHKYFLIRCVKRIKSKDILLIFSELLNSLLSPQLDNSKNKQDEFQYLINNEIEIFQTNNGYHKNESLNILMNILMGNKNNLNNKNSIKIKDKRKVQSNRYRKIVFDLIKDIFYSNSNIDQYNLISTILFPLLYLFKNAYEKDNSINIMNTQILSFLPIVGEDNGSLSEISSHFILSNNINNNQKSLEKLIDLKILNFELYTKKYIISSYLLKIIINIFSVIDIDAFFDLKQIVNNVKKEYNSNEENIHLNKYFYKIQNLLLLLSDDYYKIIGKTINILNPFLKKIKKNNFYLFLPFSIINGIGFLVKLIFNYYYIINKEQEQFLPKNNIKELINIFIDLNLKLVRDNVNENYMVKGLNNIILLFNLYENLDNYEQNMEFYFNKNHFQILFESIFNNYNKNLFKKAVASFVIYCSSNHNNKYSEYFVLNLLKYVSEDENDFFFENFIINDCIKNLIVNTVLTISTIINYSNNSKDNVFEQLEKYFNLLLTAFSCLINYINKEKIVFKIFNNFTQKSILVLDGEKIEINIENNDNEKCHIYYYFILLIILIIKKLLVEKLFMLIKLNPKKYFNDILFKLIRKTVVFLKKVIIQIPNDYQEIIEKREKESNIQEQNNNQNDFKEKEENKEIRIYYRNIIYNINKRNLENIICLLEKYDNPLNFKKIKNSLEEIISFLNEVRNKYNIKKIDSSEQKEIAKTCPICLEKYSDCHVSPCGHMFCLDCVKKLYDIRCPLCRKNMTGILEFPNIHFSQNNQENNINQNNNQINNHANPGNVNNINS